MDTEKDYCVFSQTMAGYLMMNGCKLKKIAISKQNPNMNVFYFPNTDYVLHHVDRYLNQRKNK